MSSLERRGVAPTHSLQSPVTQRRHGAGGIEEFHGGHYVDDSGVPLGVRLFAADGVTWVVSMPTGLANDTMWPDMDWIEALGSVTGDAEAETLEVVELR